MLAISWMAKDHAAARNLIGGHSAGSRGHASGQVLARQLW